jgi:putative ATPase
MAIQPDLFSPRPPLAERLRPQTLDEVIGQPHLLALGKPLRAWLESGARRSILLWGPPGTGKTTLARLAAQFSRKDYRELNAVSSGVSQIRDCIELGKRQGIVLLADELHRWSRAQADSLLEAVERGWIVLVGATTENPFVALQRPLLSRLQIFELRGLGPQGLQKALQRAIAHPEGVSLTIDPEAEDVLLHSCGGDIRRLYTLLEACSELGEQVSVGVAHQICTTLYVGCDETLYYQLVSALQKSMRGSSPQAATFYLGRLLAAGADPVRVARRILVTAAEDVGLADPQALAIAQAAFQTAANLGMPECRYALAEAVLYLAYAPKSNRVARAIDAAMRAGSYPHPVPSHLRGDRASGYRYPHDCPDGFVEQEYFPATLQEREFYLPSERGWEDRYRHWQPGRGPEV